MQHGGILLVTAAVLTCTACLGGEGKLAVRAAASGLEAGQRPVPFRIAEARGHLALGNVALALEGFRKAAREDPASIDALAGIALCYDQMRRFDLSRQYYERALALAPRDPNLLTLFATSLDAQGLRAEAASVRGEVAALAVAEPQAVPVEEAPADLQLAALAPPASPPEAAAPVGQSVTIALPAPRPIGEAKPQSVDPRAMQVAPVGRSVTVALPPPRPAPVVAAPAPRRSASGQPRLERISLTEVALFTGSGPRWRRPTALPQSLPASAEIRILNAARSHRLAARTRSFLRHYGWRQMSVGDAEAIRPRSIILYPKGRQAAATRLSARLGFVAVPRSDIRALTILLGRDATVHPALKAAG